MNRRKNHTRLMIGLASIGTLMFYTGSLAGLIWVTVDVTFGDPWDRDDLEGVVTVVSLVLAIRMMTALFGYILTFQRYHRMKKVAQEITARMTVSRQYLGVWETAQGDRLEVTWNLSDRLFRVNGWLGPDWKTEAPEVWKDHSSLRRTIRDLETHWGLVPKEGEGNATMHLRSILGVEK